MNMGRDDRAPTPVRAGARHGVDEGFRISVVIPTCRRPPLLQRCLAAVCAQSLPPTDYEVIVVDDGHDADTQALVQQVSRQPGAPALRYLRDARGVRRGPASARNVGWRSAAAPMIAFTDDDTVPAHDWLVNGLHAMRRDTAALCGRVCVPPAQGRRPTDHERMTQGLEHA